MRINAIDGQLDAANAAAAAPAPVVAAPPTLRERLAACPTGIARLALTLEYEAELSQGRTVTGRNPLDVSWPVAAAQ